MQVLRSKVNPTDEWQIVEIRRRTIAAAGRCCFEAENMQMQVSHLIVR